MSRNDQQILFKNRKPDRIATISEYRQSGGYEALSRVVGQRSPKEIQAEILDAVLLGRGGAAFPAGRKLMTVADDAPHPRYLVCNADEMEPGTFKDRVMIHTDPHMLIEGLILAAFAVEADHGIIFIRPEYEGAAKILEREIRIAEDAGYAGDNILGSNFSVHLTVHRSGGRYICGEGTAQLNALMGFRPNPKRPPPYPTEKGLWGCPTVLHNVETLCCIPHILKNGAEWFRNLALTETGAGTKIFSISGKVNRPGCYELPMGIPLSEIIEDYAGGMIPGARFKACLPGGASTRFMTAEHYHIPMDYDSLRNADHRLGTGAIMVFDHKTCLVAPFGIAAPAIGPASDPSGERRNDMIPWMLGLILLFLKVGVVLSVLLFTAAYLVWVERKVLARLQIRLGPNRAGRFGLLQPVADAVKMLTKEDIVPDATDRFIFLLAPLVVATTAMLMFAVVPFGEVVVIAGRKIPLVIADLNVGLLFVFALSSLGVYGVALGGWASNSKFALLGGIRGAAQMISYELALGLSLVPVVMLARSFSLVEIVDAQADYPFILVQPLSFAVFFISAMAESKRIPFDLPEAENELGAGYHMEYSGMRFGLFFIGEYVHIQVLGALVAVFFLGGWRGPVLPPFIWLMMKIILVALVMIWIRGTLPRLRYDQLMAMGWKVLIPLSLINIVITGLMILI